MRARSVGAMVDRRDLFKAWSAVRGTAWATFSLSQAKLPNHGE